MKYILPPYNDFLYLLQLEEYNSKRYLKLIPRFFFRRDLQQRDNLRNTLRIKVTRIILQFQTLAILILLGWGIIQLNNHIIQSTLTATLFVLILFIVPYQVLITNILIDPLLKILKEKSEQKAKELIKNRPDIKIIAITGSFGKTTTKNILYQLVRNKYKTQATPGNINTSIGIANWLQKELQPSTQLLIIEMDAYEIGEIKQACLITPPDIAVITNFGDQHLEKLGGHHQLMDANLEIILNARNNAVLIIPKDEYNKARKSLRVEELLKNVKVCFTENSNNLSYKNQALTTNLTDHTAIINMQLALKVAELLDIPKEIISHVSKHIQIPERRGDIKLINDFTVIDKSYNISEATARASVIEAHNSAARQGKDLIVVTAGIPERGQESFRVNKEYGHFLKNYSKYIILLQSIYAPAIEVGISNKFITKKANRMDKALEMAKSLGSPAKTLILMQPELTDLSY